MERDKFLTEAMGEDYHTVKFTERDTIRGLFCACGNKNCSGRSRNTDFSTWQGFGKLWEWAQEQEWLEEFLNIMDVGEYIQCLDGFTFDIQKEFVNPDRFANAVFSFLKERNHDM